MDLALLGTWCRSKGEFGGGSWKWGRLPAAGLREEKLCVAVSMLISVPRSWESPSRGCPQDSESSPLRCSLYVQAGPLARAIDVGSSLSVADMCGRIGSLRQQIDVVQNCCFPLLVYDDERRWLMCSKQADDTLNVDSFWRSAITESYRRCRHLVRIGRGRPPNVLADVKRVGFSGPQYVGGSSDKWIHEN